MKPLVLGGPSGVGKSTFATHLKSVGWCHLEADQHPLDGIDVLALRDEWNAFWGASRPEALADALCRRAAGCAGVVLSLPSGAIPSVELIERSTHCLCIRFLWADPRICLPDFLAREKKTGRNFDAAHWDSNNCGVYSKLSASRYHPYLVDVFDSIDKRISSQDIELRIRKATSGAERAGGNVA